MKNLIVISLLLFCFLSSATAVQAQDLRASKLANFFASQSSPLANYSTFFVTQADKNGLDYRLLPAISGVESTFGKNLLPESYNAYGWGGGEIYFTSWVDSIATISTALRTNYADRGATTIEQIGYIYCPPNSLAWASKVRSIMDKIDSTPPLPSSLLKLTI